MRYLFFNLPLLLFLTLASMEFTPPVRARIYKRVHKDGTVEYYNLKKYRAKKSSRRLIRSSRYDPLIEKIANKYEVDPYLIKCIIKVESDFNADAVSVAGAMGLMQLMQATAAYYDCSDPLDPEENLEIGIRHFKSLLRALEDDIPLALAAYHAGLGRVKRHGKVPPIRSTIAYVNRVMRYYEGKGNYTRSVKKLYKRITPDGTLIIYSR